MSNMNKHISTYLYLFLLPVLFSHTAFAQNQANIWYFGDRAGLDFSSGSPVVLTNGALQTFEGCASYSDDEGNLLFYSNGGGRDPMQSGQITGKIWNRDHEVMYDMGNTEGGGFSSAQSAIIIPKPGTDNQYYLFTMEEVEFDFGGSVPGQPLGRGLSYFEIDMSLNGGLGGVSLANQSVYLPLYESLSGTIHENGEDYWIVSTDNNDGNNRFVVVAVNTEGVQDPAFYNIDSTAFLNGIVKISPDGQWLYNNGNLFNFNNATGEITGPGISVQPLGGEIAVSFSPSSQYLYSIESPDFFTKQAVQYDLQAADIPASANVFDMIDDLLLAGQMQIAPDGNLYFIESDGGYETPRISVIFCADTPFPSLSRDVVPLIAGDDFSPFVGLPNFSDHIFAQLSSELIVDLGPDTLSLCPGESITLDAGNPGAEYFWSSTGENVQTITVNESGTFSVTVTNACETAEDEIVILIDANNTPSVSIDAPSFICDDVPVTLTAIVENANTILWSTGDSTAQIEVVEAGSYSVTVTGGCDSISTANAAVSLQSASSPQIDIIGGNEGQFCIGDSAILLAEGLGFDSILWSTGETTDQIAVDSGQVVLSAFNACGEITDSVFVSFIDCDTLECIVLAPNVFTPNNDGVNDVFGPVTSCEEDALLNFDMKIYNRWGELVFESGDSFDLWDGTINGDPAVTEAYFYIIQYSSPTGPPDVRNTVRTLKGNVTLVR
jgi:gliding motility-associated-like protein